ncbi:MAG: winged helix-turn-helix domain-containing protein [Ornithinimicrobium sp.]
MPSPPPADEVPPHARHTYRDATEAEAKALASGLRLRILRMTLDESLTNKEIADALGKPPASILHHVRTLVDTGFLAAQDVRRGTRGAREIPYRATGKSWYVNAPVGVHSMLEAFLSDVQGVPEDELRMTRLGLRMSQGDLDEFRDRLYALLKEMHDRPRDLSAQPHSLFLAIHPDTSSPR